MANNVYAHNREAVRVKVKKCELNVAAEWRKFSVDPQITSLEVLYSLLAKAFDIKSDFSIKYKAFDPAGNEIYLAVLSDWDLDAAFLRIHNLSIQTSTEPCLILQIDIKPFTEVKEWDADTPLSATSVSSSYASGPTAAGTNSGGAREVMSPLQQSFGVSQKYVQHMQTKLPGLIMNQMEKTISIVQKAFNLSDETMASLPPRAPLTDTEFRVFLDALGQIQRSDDLRKVIFLGGIEPSLRRVVWKHILNVYPGVMNGHQRMDYMRCKSEHYYRLRDTWKTAIKQGSVSGELAYVTSMVKKDVLRTDRLHPFYAGSDDNQNIAALFNILTTFALNHPSVSYCQGMSDIASPLLVTMNDEAQAYICFCAIMTRLRGNFLLDGIAMTQKFAHLTVALSYYDPEFWEYLKAQQADDLLFCYRWLLLELKREFPFEDALRMLEVQWSSLKYATSVDNELQLFEKEFEHHVEPSESNSSVAKSLSGSAPLSPSYLLAKPRENAYTKVCALRRQSSSASLCSLSSSIGASANAINATSKLDNTRRLNQSLDDNMSRHGSRRPRHADSFKAHQSLDEARMLMLLEGTENAAAAGDGKAANDADMDDDVFGENTASTATTTLAGSSDDSSHLNFHPTNPFKEDAHRKGTQSGASENAVARAFLCSTSSSSIVDDEFSPRGEDEDGALAPAPQIPHSIAKLHNQNVLSNYTTVSNIIAKQLAHASHVGESMKRVGSGSGGHFRELKEKIAATSRKAGISFDEATGSSQEKSQQKLVKNFNEFLNFASANKSRIADKFTSATLDPAASDRGIRQTPSPPPAAAPHALLQLKRSGFVSSLDDSEDSSSMQETTTWSGSTAATAIQQMNNLSSNSLQMDFNALSVGTPAVLTPSASIQLPDGRTSDDNQDAEQDYYYPMTTAMTRELRLESENLDRQLFGEPCAEVLPHKVLPPPPPTPSAHDDEASILSAADQCDISYEQLDKDSLDLLIDLKENEIIICPDASELLQRRRKRDAKARADEAAKALPLPPLPATLRSISLDSQTAPVNPFIGDSQLLGDSGAAIRAAGSSISGGIGVPNSSSLPEVLMPLSTQLQDTYPPQPLPVELATNACDEIAFRRTPNAERDASTTAPMLPPPDEFGGGNPFLMFLSLTLLLQHRNMIMKSGMDYNEIAMHFDKMVRKHDVTRVLNQARRMYIDYLKAQSAHRPATGDGDAIRVDVGVSAPTAAGDCNENADGDVAMRHVPYPYSPTAKS